MTIPLLNAAALLSLLAAPAEDFTWPQWDGPDRDGVSRESAWSDAGADEHLWTKELGLGYSTFSVAAGRLYSMGYDRETGLDTVWCLDALTGEQVWAHSYPSQIWDRAHEGGTVNTPTIDAEVVYSLNREGNLYCLDSATGEVRWHTVLKPEDNPHELELPTWGFSASPLVVGDELLLNCGRLLRIDKKTGKVRWRSEDFGHGYGTPAAFTLRD
ncbi:MAG: PQQ-binding-like beta-propeller repeat protein, partial [Planctomycetota bacterium]|nr:PQQ-binding-like beta-propeller repeat protein [Planctomycetota bacterium]